MIDHVLLRDVEPEDFPVFFEHQLDPDANAMAAFTSKDPADREAFMAHCEKILTDDEILMKTVLVDGSIAGNVVSFVMGGQREIGYWIGREYWGKGIATTALQAFLRCETRRPLLAYAARDNAASLRVLEKCGFRVFGEGRAYANARGMEVDEVILRLEAAPDNPV